MHNLQHTQAGQKILKGSFVRRFMGDGLSQLASIANMQTLVAKFDDVFVTPAVTSLGDALRAINTTRVLKGVSDGEALSSYARQVVDTVIADFYCDVLTECVLAMWSTPPTTTPIFFTLPS